MSRWLFLEGGPNAEMECIQGIKRRSYLEMEGTPEAQYYHNKMNDLYLISGARVVTWESRADASSN